MDVGADSERNSTGSGWAALTVDVQCGVEFEEPDGRARKHPHSSPSHILLQYTDIYPGVFCWNN